MKQIKIIQIFSLIAFAATVGLVSCEKDPTSKMDSVYNDALASPNPTLNFTNIFIPNPNFSTEEGKIVRMDISGIMNPVTKEWLELVGTNTENPSAQKIKISVEVDGKPKFVIVWNSDPTNRNNLVDYVFLVDNSGSMDEESNAVAEQIVEYATYLSGQGLDIRYGCVGYSYNSDPKIYGAINMTDADSLSTYLNRNRGRDRTVGYAGSDANILQSLANSSYSYHGSEECGVLAFRFADEQFEFRPSADIHYINFTDEPTRAPNANLSVEYTKDKSKWKQQRGTIHTVFSGATTFTRDEKPWKMSEYTGGTTLFVDPTFTTTIEGDSISLLTLPVTSVILNVYSTIRFKNTSTVPDGQHEVKITIQSADKSVQGEKVFKNVTFGNRGNYLPRLW